MQRTYLCSPTGGKQLAKQGSKAKHDSGNHMQLPGTISFNSPPNKEGEVTNGTAPKVKINGKEAATIGSMVSTCNDMGMKNNSTIIAIGMSIPMPAIINPANTSEYEQKREDEEKKKPEFSTVKWSKTKAKEGEELELSAAVKDIDDGNMVTLQVFRDGQDPAVHVALAQIPTTVDGGKATGKWTYATRGNEIPPDSDPAFFFSAHSAWCAMKKSGNVTVELKRPEITKAEWKDSEDSSTSKGLVGEVLKLSAETKDVESGVTFTVYNKATGEEVTSIGAEVEGDKAEAEWYPGDTREKDDTSELKYYFTVTTIRAKECKSSDVQVKNPQVVSMKWEPEVVFYGEDAKLKITTFEVSDESPSCKLVLREKNTGKADDFISEQDITIDKDEMEVDVKTDFDLENLIEPGESTELQIYGAITCDSLKIQENKPEYLLVGTGGIHE